MLQDKKYLEYKVTWDDLEKKKIETKTLTKRGHVMISDRDAATNNLQTNATGLLYELAEVKKENPEVRSLIEAKAKELNIEFKANLGDKKLLAKINEIEPDFKVE